MGIDIIKEVIKVIDNHNPFKQVMNSAWFKFCFIPLGIAGLIIVLVSPVWFGLNYKQDGDQISLIYLAGATVFFLLMYAIVNPNVKRFIQEKYEIDVEKGFWIYWLQLDFKNIRLDMIKDDLEGKDILVKCADDLNIKRCDYFIEEFKNLADVTSQKKVLNGIYASIGAIYYPMYLGVVHYVYKNAKDSFDVNDIKELFYVSGMWLIATLFFVFFKEMVIVEIINSAKNRYLRYGMILQKIKFDIETSQVKTKVKSI